MKTLVKHIYSYSELSPEAQARAIESLRKGEFEHSPSLQARSDEMLESLKAICEACNLPLRGGSFGTYCRDHRVEVDTECSSQAQWTGRRAAAWFLRILMRHGYDRPARFSAMRFPGVCGFTGVCYDDDIAETVWRELLDGSSVREAFGAVSGKLCDMLEQELDYRTSDAGILDMLDADDERFTEEGDLA